MATPDVSPLCVNGQDDEADDVPITKVGEHRNV